jgi:hypothetical protein
MREIVGDQTVNQAAKPLKKRFDFTDLGLFLPHFSQICQGLINLFYFFRELVFCFVHSLYGFLGLYFINFRPYFYYFSPFA